MLRLKQNYRIYSHVITQHYEYLFYLFYKYINSKTKPIQIHTYRIQYGGVLILYTFESNDKILILVKQF